jgi:ribosomal protein S21
VNNVTSVNLRPNESQENLLKRFRKKVVEEKKSARRLKRRTFKTFE